MRDPSLEKMVENEVQPVVADAVIPLFRPTRAKSGAKALADPIFYMLPAERI